MPKAEIRENGYDLSHNCYKEVEYEAAEHNPPKMILMRLFEQEADIQKGLEFLKGLLG